MPPLEAEAVAAEAFLATLKPDERVYISLAENFFEAFRGFANTFSISEVSLQPGSIASNSLWP
jgi:hypothetical protein